VKEVSHDSALSAPGSAEILNEYSTEAASSDIPSTRDGSIEGILNTGATFLPTSTITRSLTSTFTQLIALNPAYQASLVGSRSCAGVTTVTVTVLATNTMASYLPTMVKYENFTTSTTTRSKPCIPTPPPGFVGLQAASGSGDVCIADTTSPGANRGGSHTSTSALPFSTGAVGATNVNVAFLIGLAAMAVFV
jgi:hypothetical protein